MACSALCFGHCSNNRPCDYASGMCPGGCKDGYLGQFCNECKSKRNFATFCFNQKIPIRSTIFKKHDCKL